MYIKDLACISPQPTYDGSFLHGEVHEHKGLYYPCVEPEYGKVIPRMLLRRMGRAVKMGIWAGMNLIERHPGMDGIMIGTGDGAAEDFIKFMEQIIQYEEGTLTPTAFVQSTPNALAGTLALMSKNIGYNSTYVDKGSAFGSTLLDAKMLFEEKEVNSLLVGNMEQFSQFTYNIEDQNHLYKKEAVKSTELLASGTPGTVCGEGCSMFVLSDEKEGSYAEVVDITNILFPTEKELKHVIHRFLQQNDLTPEDVDSLVVGANGDKRTDGWYHRTMEEPFPHSSVYSFKHLVGEYPSSTAFAVWMASHLLNSGNLPTETLLRDVKGKPTHVMIHDHYKGEDHTLVLMRVT